MFSFDSAGCGVDEPPPIGGCDWEGRPCNTVPGRTEDAATAEPLLRLDMLGGLGGAVDERSEVREVARSEEDRRLKLWGR